MQPQSKSDLGLKHIYDIMQFISSEEELSFKRKCTKLNHSTHSTNQIALNLIFDPFTFIYGKKTIQAQRNVVNFFKNNKIAPQIAR